MSEEEPPSPKTWQRFYMGYKERFVEDCTIQLANGRTVRVKQAPSAKKQQKKKGSSTLDKDSDPALTGTTVWDGAIVLAQYLTAADTLQREFAAVKQEQQHQQLLCQSAAAAAEATGCDNSQVSLQQQQHQTDTVKPEVPAAGSLSTGRSPASACKTASELPVCLELGAGTGAVSLSLLAAEAVRCALITDIPDMLPHLQHNIAHNAAILNPRLAHVKALRWSFPADVAALAPLHPPFDLIVGADLVYYSYTPQTPHSRLLLQSLQQLAGPYSLIYLALSLHHNPEEVEEFLAWCMEWGFSVTRVTRGLPEQYRVPDVLVVHLRLVDEHKAATMAAAAAAGTLTRRDET
jgi:hypothetical protein